MRSVEVRLRTTYRNHSATETERSGFLRFGDVGPIKPPPHSQLLPEHFVYNLSAQGWIKREDNPTSPSMIWESPPDFEHTIFHGPNGDGAKACRCYRCGKVLVLEDVRIEKHGHGCLRPVCEECK